MIKTSVIKGLVLATALSLHHSATAGPNPVTLGSAADFAVLAGSTVTSTGSTIITGGNVGTSPGTAITGFPPATIAAPYTSYSAGSVALLAQSDLTTAYNTAGGEVPTEVLTGQDLGGLTLTPGVYFFSTSAQLTGTLTLDDQGNPNAQFVFQIGSTLTTASDSAVVTIHGGPGPGGDVFWQVGSSATLGTDTAFEGNIMALASITADTGASDLDGRLLAQNGAVTLDGNDITAPASVPEPKSLVLLLGSGVFAFLFYRRIGFQLKTVG